MKSNLKVNRRDFLKTASMLSAAAPFFLPSKVWGADTAPSNRLTMGFIGMGKQGRYLLNNFLNQETRVLAVCDVDTTRRNDVKQKVDKHYGNQDCASYNDFREIIARKDIDAVFIGTPDHWHAIPTLAVLRSGKDVYCEKPLTHNIHEAVEVLKARRMLDALVMVHFHIGSQITDIRKIKDAIKESGRVYAKLARSGVEIQYLNLGGGLGVDYDGSKTAFDSSMNYTV